MGVLLLPWIMILLIVAAVFCGYKRWWWAVGGVVVVILLMNFFGEVLPLNILNPQTLKPLNSQTLSVLTWNIHGGDKDTVRYEGIAKKILKEDADVVFLAELFTETQGVMDSLLKEKYPYRSKVEYMAHSIYSKVPVDTSYIVEVDGGNEVIIMSRIKAKDVWWNVYGCHLTSNNYTDEDGRAYSFGMVHGVGSLFDYIEGIGKASEQRALEADEVVRELSDDDGMVLVVGDFNDVSGSGAMNIFEKAGLTDAWWKGGCGYGATIHSPLPYRIDHILYRGGKGLLGKVKNCFELKSIKKINNQGLSDHDALVAEFELK